MTVAELAVRLPAILVPYPHAAADHQTANARAVRTVRRGRAPSDDELVLPAGCRRDARPDASRRYAGATALDPGDAVAGWHGYVLVSRTGTAYGHWHFVGIGGIGMKRDGARPLGRGESVSGSDLRETH